jgi:isoquinoline 1-oxidoreductase subunit alpha
MANQRGLVRRSFQTLKALKLQLSKGQNAWTALDVPQCGYCQSGQVMAAIALLEENKTPTDDDIDAALSGNICRCATYQRIRSAVHQAAESLA